MHDGAAAGQSQYICKRRRRHGQVKKVNSGPDGRPSCCTQHRFCLASYLTLPFRAAPLEGSLIPTIERGLAVTDRIGLLGEAGREAGGLVGLAGCLSCGCRGGAAV